MHGHLDSTLRDHERSLFPKDCSPQTNLQRGRDGPTVSTLHITSGPVIQHGTFSLHRTCIIIIKNRVRMTFSNWSSGLLSRDHRISVDVKGLMDRPTGGQTVEVAGKSVDTVLDPPSVFLSHSVKTLSILNDRADPARAHTSTQHIQRPPPSFRNFTRPLPFR